MFCLPYFGYLHTRQIISSRYVTYWPSTEPSIKRYTCINKQWNSGNRCIRSKISEYHLDLWSWLNSGQMRTPTGSRWRSNNYITRCHRRLESVGVWVAVPVGDKMPEWEPAPDSSIMAPNITPQGHNLVQTIPIMVHLCHNLVHLPPISLLQRGKTDRKFSPGKWPYTALPHVVIL